MDRTSAANYADIGGGKRGFRNRNLLTGLRGTTHDAADRNAVQEEIMAVVEAAGITPNATNWTQLLQGLHVLFGGGGSLGTTGWQRLPDGLILQWGTKDTSASGQVTVTYPIAFPNAVFQVQVTVGSIGPYVAVVDSAVPGTATNFRLHGWDLSGNRISFGTMWLATGR